MIKALQDYVFKPRSPHKPTKSHKDQSKYTRKTKHKKDWV